MTTRKIHSGFVWAINKSRIAKTHSTVTFTRELIQIITMHSNFQADWGDTFGLNI